LLDASLSGDDAARVLDVGAGRGVEPVLQSRAGYRRRALDSTLDDLVSRASALALFLSRPGAGCALLHGGAALGHRTIQARGSALPGGGTARVEALAAAALAGEGLLAKRRSSMLLFRLDRRPALAQLRRRWACLADRAHRRCLSRFCHGSAGLYGVDPHH